jgi:hypothetical protein
MAVEENDGAPEPDAAYRWQSRSAVAGDSVEARANVELVSRATVDRRPGAE